MALNLVRKIKAVSTFHFSSTFFSPVYCILEPPSPTSKCKCYITADCHISPDNNPQSTIYTDDNAKRYPALNERGQKYDINVTAGPGRIECVKVEAPLRLAEKSAACRESGEEEEEERGGRKRTDGCDLCLTPRGISATDNLIQLSA